MYRFTIERSPLRINAEGSTRAGLIVAAVKGLFEAAELVYPEAGEESKRAFEIETTNAPELILAVLRLAAATANTNKEIYNDISFSLITDKKAVGVFVGRPSSEVHIPAIHGIDGEVVKDGDGLWRAVIALATK